MCDRPSKADPYAKCGRKAMISPENVKWLVGRLKALRLSGPCTMHMLQRELAKKKNVEADESTVRKVLNLEGFRYLPRIKKTRYTLPQRVRRVAISKEITDMSQKELDMNANMCMDGVVLVRPPNDPDGRVNFVRSDETKVWRTVAEKDLPECHGHDQWKKQAPLARLVPLWGGLAANGFSVIFFHPRRKTDSEDWSKMVRQGGLTKALKSLNPKHQRKSWRVLCDNESFLQSDESKAAHKKAKVRLWQIPAKSPDLNPVEKFWAWLRKKLGKMDLADLVANRPVPGPTAYKERVRRVLKNYCSSTCYGVPMNHK